MQHPFRLPEHPLADARKFLAKKLQSVLVAGSMFAEDGQHSHRNDHAVVTVNGKFHREDAAEP